MIEHSDSFQSVKKSATKQTSRFAKKMSKFSGEPAPGQKSVSVLQPNEELTSTQIGVKLQTKLQEQEYTLENFKDLTSTLNLCDCLNVGEL